MQKLHHFFLKIYAAEKDNLWLWMPVLFGFGAAFYFSYEANFVQNFVLISLLFFSAVSFSYLNRHSLRMLIFLACSLFLLGSFYAYFYQKIFISDKQVTGKIYVDALGKVESVKKFSNPVNGAQGLNLVISEPVLYKSKFLEKKKDKKKKSLKKKHKKKKSKKKKEQKEKKPRKPRKKKLPIDNEIAPLSPEGLEKNLEEKNQAPKKKSGNKKAKKKRKISAKTIQKNFLNLADYQEIDREFLDFSKNYQTVAWLEIKGREVFPNPPQKISVNLIRNFQDIAVNDVLAMRLMLQPAKSKDFADDFDFARDAKFKKIGAYGYVLGEAKIVKKSQLSSLDAKFLDLREKIRARILNVLQGDAAAIALAFLIGDQNQISQELMTKIRNSGLAHLLSISGFHLSLASAICFVSARFILSRSQHLALHFDLKKIAAIAAIFGTYFYLKIADSPLPAQRAFLSVLFGLIALFIGEKINAKRAVMFGALALILFNPYAVFSISFQLSFAAILVLCSFIDYKNHNHDSYFLRRIFRYFREIILVSILIQIATIPFLMHSFRSFTVLGFVANIAAIPLTSFFVMPVGFLALILMPLNLEKYFLLLMEKGIILIEKIAIYVADLNFSYLASPDLSSIGLVIAIIGLLLVCLSKSHLRFLGILLFCSCFLTIFLIKKPDILFDGKQKFFAANVSDGLIFSKDLKPSKKRRLWMDKMDEKQFKSLNSHPQKDIFCDEMKCLIEKNHKILVIIKRSKISEICKNDFDVIVNLTSKYKLPGCISENKIKIDNFDFYKKGGQFFYFKGDELLIKTTS